MVRSIASSDSGTDFLCSSDSSDSGDLSDSASAAAARERADRAEAERRRRNFREWYRRRLAVTLCELAVAAMYQRDCQSSRQITGRLSAYKRRCAGHTTGSVVAFTLPQLDRSAAQALQHDCDLIHELYEEPFPQNDETWIYSDMVGRHQDPGRVQVEQRVQLFLLQSLVPRLQSAGPEFLHRAVLCAGGGLYRDFIWLVWPLLTSDDRFVFQQWYYGQPESRPAGEVASEQPERAALVPSPGLRPVSQKTRTADPPENSARTFAVATTRKRSFKRAQLRAMRDRVVQYHAPVIWSVATASPAAVIGAFPSSSRGLRPLFQAWRASVDFCIAQRRLRQHTRQQKNAHVESLIREAHAASGKGLTAVHRLTQRNSKRSIHFRRATGELQTPEEELAALRSYFQDLYESRTVEHRDWSLQQAFDVTDLEVHRALSALMTRKALPPGHAPALLWRAASDLLHQRVKEALNSCLGPGQIALDADWNKSYLTLMPKVGKPPSCPANLRPINLLPAFPKMLARIAADRLKPLVARALHGLPQYAYSGGRQTSDSLDRVLSHCQSIAARLAGLPTGTLGRSALHARHQLIGMEVSVDKTVIVMAIKGVTQVLRIRCQCRICGQAFPSTHALSVHMGKSHAEVKASSMAFVAMDELQNASQELAQFSAMMARNKPSPSPEALSTKPPSTADLEAEEPAQEVMDLDPEREKRERASLELGETAPKFAKGDTKGQDSRSSVTASNHDRSRADHKNWWGGGSHRRQDRAGQDGWDNQWPSRRDNDRRDNRRDDRRSDRETQDTRLRELLLAMARLLLRLEDAQSVMLLDTEFIFFLQTKASGNQWAIVDSLHQVALRWHAMKEQNPASLQQPMRIVLLTCLLEALLNQMQLLESNPEAMQKAVDMGLVEGSSYVYLQWDSSLKKHIKSAQEPLPHQTAVQIVRQLQNLLICPDTVGRFHALRKLAPNMSSDVVPFSLAVQNRNQEAMQMYGLFRRLARNSCLHLIACTMRPSKLQRSPLAQQINRMLQNM
ncbi:unnamed protein product [Symbiodinium microadriaticum]|nr:unnamed protein product [Symbiodinium microadriaticum]